MKIPIFIMIAITNSPGGLPGTVSYSDLGIVLEMVPEAHTGTKEAYCLEAIDGRPVSKTSESMKQQLFAFRRP